MHSFPESKGLTIEMGRPSHQSLQSKELSSVKMMCPEFPQHQHKTPRFKIPRSEPPKTIINAFYNVTLFVDLQTARKANPNSVDLIEITCPSS